MCFFFIFGVDLFYYFYCKMVCVGFGSRHCRTETNTAVQNLQKFYHFRAALSILHTTASSAKNLHAQNRRILTSLSIGLVC